jgi:hypothetical protein
MFKDLLSKVPKKLLLILFSIAVYLTRGIWDDAFFGWISNQLEGSGMLEKVSNIILDNQDLIVLLFAVITISIVGIWSIWDIRRKSRLLIILSILERLKTAIENVAQGVEFSIPDFSKVIDKDTQTLDIVGMKLKGMDKSEIDIVEDNEKITIKFTGTSDKTQKQYKEGLEYIREKMSEKDNKLISILPYLLDLNEKIDTANDGLEDAMNTDAECKKEHKNIEDYFKRYEDRLSNTVFSLIQVAIALSESYGHIIILRNNPIFRALSPYVLPAEVNHSFKNLEEFVKPAIQRVRVAIGEGIREIEEGKGK